MSRGVLLLLAAGCLLAQDPPTVTFGTTVASSSGLQGELFLLKPDTEQLPNFKRMKSVGTIYTTALQIWPRPFEQGFPGITDRFEWFALDYTGRFWIEKPGVYRFRLLSDDGSKLFVDDKLLIDNDGQHAPITVDGRAEFSRGVHRLRVQYFQGPRAQVALVLAVAMPDSEEWAVFDTNRFQPPADPAEWIDGTIKNVKRGRAP